MSILGDYCFYFPTPRKLDKVMKDYLEDSVDEKYYISSDKSQALIDKLLADDQFREKERECVDLSLNNPQKKEIANCISARTDRGISNRKSEGNGVIERKA